MQSSRSLSLTRMLRSCAAPRRLLRRWALSASRKTTSAVWSRTAHTRTKEKMGCWKSAKKDSEVGKDREVFKMKTEFKSAIEKSVANLTGLPDIAVLFKWCSLSNRKIGTRYWKRFKRERVFMNRGIFQNISVDNRPTRCSTSFAALTRTAQSAAG